jgi:hypothetical protein
MEQNLTDIIMGIDFKVLNNVTDPSITVSPYNDTICLSYSKTENNQTRIYLLNSTNSVESFSPPIEVNSIAGDATKNPWTATTIAIGPNKEVCVL